MPAWPGLHGYTPGILHRSARAQLAVDLAGAEGPARRARPHAWPSASLEQIEKDPVLQNYAMAVGQSIFGDNCAACHGAGGTGRQGLSQPARRRLAVGRIAGGHPAHHHLRRPLRRSRRPRLADAGLRRWTRLLKPDQIDDLTEYVVWPSRTGKARRGRGGARRAAFPGKLRDLPRTRGPGPPAGAARPT